LLNITRQQTGKSGNAAQGRGGEDPELLVSREDGVAYGTLESNTQCPFATIYSKCVS
jgi:hypothetical protein